MNLYQHKSREIVSLVQYGLLLFLMLAANISIAFSQLSLGLSLILLVTQRVVFRQKPLNTGLEKPALFLALWALLNLLFSTDQEQSFIFYRRFFLFSAIWVTATIAVNESRRRWLLIMMLLGAFLICLYGQIKILVTTGALFNVRLGEMSNPMTSGALLMMVLLTVAGIVLSPGTATRTRFVTLVVSLPVFVGLLQTFTRSAWLGLVAGLLAILLVIKPRLVMIFVPVSVVVLLALPHLPDSVIPSQHTARLNLKYILHGRSTNVRMQMWQGGLNIIRQNPIVGVGDRDLMEIAPEYYDDHGSGYFGHLHSNPVMLAVIWGIPGLILAMFFLLIQPWLLIKRWQQLRAQTGPPNIWQQGWVLGAIGVWAGFFLAGFTEWYFGDAESMLLYLAIVGIALGGSTGSEEYQTVTNNNLSGELNG